MKATKALRPKFRVTVPYCRCIYVITVAYAYMYKYSILKGKVMLRR
jgi:hypothetical protein